MLYAREHGHTESWTSEGVAPVSDGEFADSSVDVVTLLTFIRVATRQDVFERPLQLQEALELADRWIKRPSVIILHAIGRHMLLRNLIKQSDTAGHLTSDARVAAIAIDHKAELWSA